MRHFALIRNSSIACAALAGVLLQPGPVAAVALGNIALQSSLGQPLRAVIPVALNNGEILNTSCIKLMRDQEAGTAQLLTGRVSVERSGASTRLQVTTPRAIDEPALRISVQAGCGNTVRRDYVLLLDPQGTASNAMVASAEPNEFDTYLASSPPATGARRPVHVERAAAPVVARAADPAPARTDFAPIAAPAPVAVARTPREASSAPSATPAAAPLVAAPAPQRGTVLLTAVQPQGSFIPEAAAASFTRVSADNPSPIATSMPTARLGARTASVSPDETLWTQTWPYAAVLLSLAAIALTALAKRRHVAVPSWGAPTVSNSKTPMQNSGAANTFAHFDAMTEPGKITLRPVALANVPTETAYDTSLDTLLEAAEPEADMIDEHVIRRTWATLAHESAVDIGTDSILNAIAAAEREMRIAPPEPKQAAIDKALDDDLLREPKLRR